MAKKSEAVVEIRPIVMERVKLRIVGDSPLIVHQWSEKTKREILGKQTAKKAASKKELRDPTREFIDSLYWICGKPEEPTMEAFDEAVASGAKFGFPVTAIKKAALNAAYRKQWIKNRMEIAGDFYLEGDADGLVEVMSDEPPEPREDMVRIGMGTADLRYRAMFRRWWIDLVVVFDSGGAYDLGSIVNIISAGGSVCGIGEWRVEKLGQYGTYHVEPV